jgi:hypothetical protein
MLGSGVLCGGACCAIAGEANNAVMAATDKIAFIFNLLSRIVGGGGRFIRILPADKRAFLMVSISQIRPSGETAWLRAHLSGALGGHKTPVFGAAFRGARASARAFWWLVIVRSR